MVKLKQVVMPLIEFIQDNNKTNKLPSFSRGYADMNPHSLYKHNHQIILDKIVARKILTMMNMWKMEITTMYIVMILMIMIRNKSYFTFNLL